jgi:heme/copper-type cytochrome/quinol oxidase subunit 2
VKKSVRIGIIAVIIVVLSVLSIGTLSQIDDYKSTSKDAVNVEQESKPPGKDLSIELEEKMGFTAP